MRKIYMQELLKEAARVMYVIFLTILGLWAGNGIWWGSFAGFLKATGEALVITCEQVQILETIRICEILATAIAVEWAAIKVADWGIR